MKKDTISIYVSLAILLIGLGFTVAGVASQCFVSEQTVLTVIRK